MTLQAPISAMPLAYGQVTSVENAPDPYSVKVRLHAFTGPATQEGEIWARVAAPFAGSGYGAVMLPDVGQEVIVGFVSGDGNFPIVLGALYHAEAQPADAPVEGSTVKRWSLKGQGGTHVILDESQSSAVTLETSGGVRVTVTDDGQKVEATNGSSTVTIEPAGVKIETGAKVEVQASTVDVTAGSVNVSAALSSFSGVVKCDVLQTNTVVSTTYTPGAGNVW